MFREVLGHDVTPVQYAILRMLQELPGIDRTPLRAAPTSISELPPQPTLQPAPLTRLIGSKPPPDAVPAVDAPSPARQRIEPERLSIDSGFVGSI